MVIRGQKTHCSSSFFIDSSCFGWAWCAQWHVAWSSEVLMPVHRVVEKVTASAPAPRANDMSLGAAVAELALSLAIPPAEVLRRLVVEGFLVDGGFEYRFTGRRALFP